MALQDNTKSPAFLMATLVQGMLGLFGMISNQIRTLAGRVYAGGPDAASANVAAMGTNAALIFQIASIIGTALNQIAPLIGKPTISIIPDGYTFTPNLDGSGVLTYTAAAPASNASSGTTA